MEKLWPSESFTFIPIGEVILHLIVVRCHIMELDSVRLVLLSSDSPVVYFIYFPSLLAVYL